jgi:SAM-dependent methyltransferase
MDRFVTSRHLSWFQRRDVLYLYHDLYGFLLEMSADLKSLVDFFGDAQTAEEAAQAYSELWNRDQIGQFMGVFLQHKVLVPENVKEIDGLADVVPIKGPWILAHRLDDGTIQTVTSRGFGSEPWAKPVLEKWDAWASELWRSIDGERPLRRLAMAMTEAYDGDLQEDLQHAQELIAAWTHSKRQLTRTLPAPRSQMQRVPPYASSTMPYAPYGYTGLAYDDSDGGPHSRDLKTYHQQTIQDAEAQFEELETTLSHLLSDPHPALNNRSYGQKFAGVALSHGWLGAGRPTPAHGWQVAEVGGGTGRFAAAMVAELAKELSDLHYTVVDLSPALHAAQTQRLSDAGLLGPGLPAATLIGDAQQLPFGDAAIDFLVSNEVIADLPMGMITRASIAAGQVDGESDATALEIFRRYALSAERAPEPVPIQVGATRFVEEIARVLRPGGTAVVTEFGDEKQFPIESTHLDHGEWSVHFGHLAQVAEKNGLRASLVPVPELISLDPSVWVLASNRTQFRNLRYLLRSVGCDLPKRALTPEQFSVACGGSLRADRLEGLQFRPIGERVMGIVPSEFKALVLQKAG